MIWFMLLAPFPRSIFAFIEELNFPEDSTPKIPGHVVAKQKVTVVAVKNVTDIKKISVKNHDSVVLATSVNRVSVISNVKEPIIVDWKPTEEAITKCMNLGYPSKRCQNHILLVQKTDNSSLLICGTNAYNPACNYYNITQTKRHVSSVQTQTKPMPSSTLIPTDPYAPLYSYYTSDKQLFIALGIGLIRRFPMDNTDAEHSVLASISNSFSSRGPVNFIRMLETKQKVFIFFTEIDAKSGKLVSRVATICVNDAGDMSDHQFTTFVKATINCPVSDEFSFNEMTSVSAIFDINNEPAVLATFVTKVAIPGSAVCGFKLSQIESTLLQNFKTTTEHAPWDQYAPPSACQDRITSEGITYVHAHEPLVNGAVPAINKAPLLTRTVFTQFKKRDLFTSIEVQETDYKLRVKTLIAIGTSRSKLLRATVNLDPSDHIRGYEIIELLSEQSVHKPQCDQNKLGIQKIVLDHDDKLIFVHQPGCVVQLPLMTCDMMQCESECISGGDPNCNYNRKKKLCTLRRGDSFSKTEVLKFKPCQPSSTTVATPTKNALLNTIETTHTEVEIVEKLGESVAQKAAKDDLDLYGYVDNNTKQSMAKNIIIYPFMLLVGIFLGVVMVVFCKKFKNNGMKGDAAPNMDTEAQQSPTQTMIGCPNSRTETPLEGSYFPNERVQPRIQSTGSDSSNDSGFIRASGDQSQIQFESATTGRVKPRTLALRSSNYNTIANTSSSSYKPEYKKQFGSMKYETTAAPNNINDDVSNLQMHHQQPKVRLGSSSLQQQYSTMPNQRPNYTRQQSVPNTEQQNKFTVSPTKQNQASYYSTIRKSNNEKPFRRYNMNDATHYATLPKADRQAGIKRTPSTGNTLQSTKLIPVPTPTLDQLPACNLFSTKAT